MRANRLTRRWALIGTVALGLWAPTAVDAAQTPSVRAAFAWAAQHQEAGAQPVFVFCYNAGGHDILCRILYDGPGKTASCEKDIFVSKTSDQVERQLGTGCYRTP